LRKKYEKEREREEGARRDEKSAGGRLFFSFFWLLNLRLI
jgi:hypothetical protein